MMQLPGFIYLSAADMGMMIKWAVYNLYPNGHNGFITILICNNSGRQELAMG